MKCLFQIQSVHVNLLEGISWQVKKKMIKRKQDQDQVTWVTFETCYLLYNLYWCISLFLSGYATHQVGLKEPTNHFKFLIAFFHIILYLEISSISPFLTENNAHHMGQFIIYKTHQITICTYLCIIAIVANAIIHLIHNLF